MSMIAVMMPPYAGVGLLLLPRERELILLVPCFQVLINLQPEITEHKQDSCELFRKAPTPDLVLPSQHRF